MFKLPLMMNFGKRKTVDGRETAVQATDTTERPLGAKSRPKDLEDKNKGVEFGVDGELHLRGGAGRASTRYTSTTARRTLRTRGSSGSSGSYVSYASGGKSGSGRTSRSYVSYGSGGYEKRHKAYTAKPRFQIYCCACM